MRVGSATHRPLAVTCAVRRGTRQVRHRYTPGPPQVTGDRPGREPFGPGADQSPDTREPRHPDAGPLPWTRRRGEPPTVSARYQRKFRPGARRSGWAARAFRRILPLNAGRTQELPVTSRAPAGPSPGRTTAPAKKASGSVNRLLRPGSVRHMSVTTAMQRLIAAHHDTRRDSSKKAREAGKTQLTGRFRRWWQVLGSNQRRRSRRFYRPPAETL